MKRESREKKREGRCRWDTDEILVERRRRRRRGKLQSMKTTLDPRRLVGFSVWLCFPLSRVLNKKSSSGVRQPLQWQHWAVCIHLCLKVCAFKKLLFWAIFHRDRERGRHAERLQFRPEPSPTALWPPAHPLNRCTVCAIWSTLCCSPAVTRFCPFLYRTFFLSTIPSPPLYALSHTYRTYRGSNWLWISYSYIYRVWDIAVRALIVEVVMF